MNITIIGLGLIGGSIALSLRETDFPTRIYGVDKNEENAAQALGLNIANEITDLDTGIEKADLIIIAVPVDATAKLLPYILDRIKPETVVTDMGSTKKLITGTIANHPNKASFVPSHPIAGTENFGPAAAFKTLFRGKVGIICDQEKCKPAAVAVIEELYRQLGMQIIYMDSQEHDLHLAYVSHLSHISSFALGLTVLEKEKDEKTIFNLAGSGFASTVRLAKSSPEMWTSICIDNSQNLSRALGTYIETLQNFKNCIDSQDYGQIHHLMTEANHIRKVLEGLRLTYTIDIDK